MFGDPATGHTLTDGATALMMGSYTRYWAQHAMPVRQSCADAISSEARYVILTKTRRTHCRPRLLPRSVAMRLANGNSAFQRLGFAFDILKSPSARRSYDRASKPSSSSLPDKTSFLGGEFTFRSAVETVLHEFMTGDFAVVRRWLDSLHQRYPHLVSSEVCIGIEKSFIRIRELVLTTTTYALLIYVELGRIHRVQKRLMGLGYLDVVGRTRLTILLVKVTLAVPMRVDRKLREKEEQKWRAEEQGCLARDGRERTAGILNERVSKVLEFIVGDAGLDEGVEDGGKAGAK